jgi:beta-lactamase regulating signal transducer with metallopeptidase domain
MSGVFKTILIMSVSGGLIALALFVLKPLVKNRLPKSAQYYLWLVVLAALLVPVSGLFALPVGLNPMYATKAMLEPTVEVPFASAMLAPQEAIGDALNGGLGTITMYLEPLPDGTQATTEFFHSQVWVSFGSYAWGFGFAAVLLYYLIGYAVFTRRHRRGNIKATPEELAALAELCGEKRNPLLYRNPLAATPMLIGVFRPAIVLPDRGYTDAQLRAVLLHELTHLRRGDVLVKWLSVLACAVHWFNPVVWLVRREIDRACELACDEAVIRGLDADGKRNYGETLLYVAADAKTPRAVLSTTMCEEKRALKERLGAILRSRKHTRWAVVLSVVLLVAVSGTALALGAGRTEGEGLIEMQLVYRDNPAFFFDDMNLLWGDTIYYVVSADSPERGREIGYATDEYSTWRIYEVKGYGQDYLLAVESEDVWRVMSSHAPEKPWRQYILENATDRQRVERMLSVSLYVDGTAHLATSLISSYSLLSPYYYTFLDGELLIHYEDNNTIAKFTVVDDNTIVFKEASVPLYADEGARYVVRYDDVDEFIANNPPYPAVNDGNTPAPEPIAVTARAPQLDVGIDGQSVRAAQLSSSWQITYENGDGMAVHTDSYHPLQNPDGYDDSTLLLSGSENAIELRFSDNYPPQSVAVQRWNAENIGADDLAAVLDEAVRVELVPGERVGAAGSAIAVSHDGQGYLYEVHATWPEGESRYAFCTSAAVPR